MPGPQWIDTAASVFSAVGTVGAFAIGMGLLRQEHKREELRAEEERRSQAVKVSAWIETERTPQGGRTLSFHVHNASEMPIYEVSLPMLIPTEDEHEAEFIGLVPPGQTVRRPAPRDWLKTYFSPEPVQIEFLDSSGRQWTRDEQGFLARADGETSAPPAAESRPRRFAGVLSVLRVRPRSTRSARAGSGRLVRWIGVRRRRGRTGRGSR